MKTRFCKTFAVLAGSYSWQEKCLLMGDGEMRNGCVVEGLGICFAYL